MFIKWLNNCVPSRDIGLVVRLSTWVVLEPQKFCKDMTGLQKFWYCSPLSQQMIVVRNAFWNMEFVYSGENLLCIGSQPAAHEGWVWYCWNLGEHETSILTFRTLVYLGIDKSRIVDSESWEKYKGRESAIPQLPYFYDFFLCLKLICRVDIWGKSKVTWNYLLKLTGKLAVSSLCNLQVSENNIFH